MKHSVYIILAAIYYTCISTAVAQTSSNATGGTGSGSGGNISFSVGQIDFISITNFTNAGVQQAYDSSVSLPVHLLSFQAIKSKQEVDVKWKTATEVNSSHFIVERSINGVTFTNIGIVNSAGNSNSPRTYTLTDTKPFVGTNYYRLKQVDKDGKFIYSSIAAVDFEAGISISCYPNPASSFINLQINLADVKDFSFRLHDVSGKLLISAAVTNTITRIPFASLKPATYRLTIYHGKSAITLLSIVKQ